MQRIQCLRKKCVNTKLYVYNNNQIIHDICIDYQIEHLLGKFWTCLTLNSGILVQPYTPLISQSQVVSMLPTWRPCCHCFPCKCLLTFWRWVTPVCFPSLTSPEKDVGRQGSSSGLRFGALLGVIVAVIVIIITLVVVVVLRYEQCTL